MNEELEKTITFQESPNREYIEAQMQLLLEKFEGDEQAQETIKKAIQFVEQGDAKMHEEVGYHCPQHVLTMARHGEATVASPAFSKLIEKFNMPRINFRKCYVVASILHDIGYYTERDPKFDTIKIGHEDRSKKFVRENKKELWLKDDEVELICQMMDGTKTSEPLKNITEADNLAEVGAALLGTYDIIGSDDDYVNNIRFLRDEFYDDAVLVQGGIHEILKVEDLRNKDDSRNQKPASIDADALKGPFKENQKATVPGSRPKTNEKTASLKPGGVGIAVDTMMAGLKELKSMPYQEDGDGQIKRSKIFYNLFGIGRINKTGLATIEVSKQNEREIINVSSEYIPASILEIVRANLQQIYDFANSE